MNLYYYLMEFLHIILNLFDHKTTSIHNKHSLIIDNYDIEILNVETETESNVNVENIKNYLNHHILLKDHKFITQYFEKPIFVNFSYMNETYKICLKNMIYTYDNHEDIIKKPKILTAILKTHEDEYDVTDIIRQYHGNNKNFFKHIPDVINDLSFILNRHGELYMYDMLGNIEKHELKKNT